MKLIKINIFLLQLLLFLHTNQFLAEGFIAGTLIKTPHGYTQIEDLRIEDSIISNDTCSQLVEDKIVHITKKIIDYSVSLDIGNENICCAGDQLLYKQDTDNWVTADSLKTGDRIANTSITITQIDNPIQVYLLSTEKHHNFLVTKNDITAHNFFPPIILAISATFGLGSAECAGISFGLAGLGGFLGYKWHKNNKAKHTISLEPQFYGNGMMPEDPDNEKKRKRDETRANCKPLTNQEARELAENLGYREIKNHPCGNTYNKPVFTNGKDYISPDRTVHKGGVWKVFNKRGDRIATANIDFTITIGK